MIHLNKKFEVVDRNKGIVGSVLTTFFVANIVLLVVTSFYKYDGAISLYFSKGMDIPVIKGGASGTVMDGFNLVVSVSIPMGMILFESLYVYYKNRNTKISAEDKKIILKSIYGVILFAYEIMILILIPIFTGIDQGFTKRIVFGFLIGYSYSIPIYIVSFLINNVICLSLVGYIHFDLAKRKDFLKAGYGRTSLKFFMLLAINYLLMGLLKSGFARPHPYRIEGHDFSGKIKDLFPDEYAHYMGQDTYNWGGITPGGPKDADIQGEGPGGKVGAKGGFAGNVDYNNNFAPDSDFPSGHVVEIGLVIFALQAILFKSNGTKKGNAMRLTIFFLTFLGMLDMTFALLVTMGHGESDMAFSMVVMYPTYFLSNGLIDLIISSASKNPKFLKVFARPIKK